MTQQPIKPPDYSPDEFVDQERKEEASQGMEKARALAQRLALDKRTTIFIGERGTGKSWLLANLRDEIEKLTGIIVFLLDLSDYAELDPIQAVTEVLKKFADDVLGQQVRSASRRETSVTLAEMGRALMQEVRRVLEKQSLAVLVDSVYESDWKVLAALEDYLLGPLAIEPNVLIVMAGRGRPYPWKTPELRLKADFRDLKPFEKLDTTVEQLKRQKPEAVPKAEEIHELSGGNPLANFLLASYEEPAQALDQVIRGMLETVPTDLQSMVREYLEALCVLRTFDEERIPTMLAAYHSDLAYLNWSYAQRRQVRGELVKSAFARWDEIRGGYVIDEPTRRLVERYLEEANIPRWRALHCAAYRLYSQWAKDYPRAHARWQQEVDHHAARLREANFSPEDCPPLEKHAPVDVAAATAVPA